LSEDEIVLPEGYGPERIPGRPGRHSKPAAEPVLPVVKVKEPQECELFDDRQKPIGTIILYPETPEQEATRLARAPIEVVVPESGIFRLGPRNPSSVGKFARIIRAMIKQKIPFPRSRFAKYVSDRVTGEDKQDFSMIITGKKGTGKSYSSLRLCQSIAEEHARNLGQDKKEFFTIDNCCLLEDTNGINKLVKNSTMYQIILIDDAGVAVGSRDFSTTNNKNFNKLLSTCRTKRWVIILNTPAKTHIDKQIRELVDCWAHVFMSAHHDGFNILKINSLSINEHANNQLYQKRYEFDTHKVDLWAVPSPDKETVREYDARREAAAQKLIDEMITGEEAPKVGKREQHKQNMLTKYSERIIAMINEGKSERSVLAACPGLSNSMLLNLRAELGV
jgi:hypothetical protein